MQNAHNEPCCVCVSSQDVSNTFSHTWCSDVFQGEMMLIIHCKYLFLPPPFHPGPRRLGQGEQVGGTAVSTAVRAGRAQQRRRAAGILCRRRPVSGASARRPACTARCQCSTRLFRVQNEWRRAQKRASVQGAEEGFPNSGCPWFVKPCTPPLLRLFVHQESSC